MPTVMEDMEKRVRSFSDGPPFAIAYLRYMSVFRDLAPRTAVTSFLTVREFCQYIHYKEKFHETPPGPESHKQSICAMDIHEMEPVSVETAREFISFLENIVGNNPQTINRKLSTLRSFYSYLDVMQQELGICIRCNPFRDIKLRVEPKKAVIMTDTDIRQLLWSISGRNDVRDKAIITLLLSSGLRLEELANLDLDNLQDNTLIVKGENARLIELNDNCVAVIEDYFQRYRSPVEDMLKDNALFISQSRKKRLSHRCIQQIIDKRVSEAGLHGKGYTANTLRDTAIQKLLNSCQDFEVPAAMDYLGFKKLESKNRFQTSVAAKMRSLDIPGGDKVE